MNARSIGALGAGTVGVETLLKLRGFYLLLQTLAVAWWWQLPVAWMPVSGLILAQILFSLASGYWYLVRGQAMNERAAAVQLAFDLLALGAFLFLTGGATNALVSLLLLPVAVAAMILSRALTHGLTVLAITEYSLLMRFHWPGPTKLSTGGLHFAAMWITFIVSALLLATLLAGLARTIRRQDLELSRQRERVLRDEQVVAIGALAASAAHELGTPLSSASLLLDEVDPAGGDGGVLEVIRQQLGRCRDIVRRIAEEARSVQAHEQRRVMVQDYVESVLERWRVGHPDIDLDCEFAASTRGKTLHVDATLGASLMCMLDNSARAGLAAGERVLTLCVQCDENTFQLRILDRGSGLSPELYGSLGKGPVLSEHGMGVGLFLANVSVERLGGKVWLAGRDQGGVCTTLRLPVAGSV